MLLTHAVIFFPAHNILTDMVAPSLGFIGVELFFGLSGYLIGSMLLTRPNQLPLFYLKRLMKILPPYLMIMLVLVLAGQPHVGLATVTSHMLFIQNFFPGQASFFPVSWSLAIEFWFYLLVPLLLVGAGSLNRRSGHLLMRCIVILVALLAARIAYVVFLAPNWEFGVHRFIPLRFDTLCFGVLAAVIAHHHKTLYEQLAVRRMVIAAVGLLVALSSWFGYLYGYDYIINHNAIFQTIGLTLVGAATLVLVLGARKLKPPFRNRWILSLVTFISTISYSLYLVHLFVYLYVAKFPGNQWVLWGIAMITSILGAYVFYETIEKAAQRISRYLQHTYFSAPKEPFTRAIEAEITKQP